MLMCQRECRAQNIQFPKVDVISSIRYLRSMEMNILGVAEGSPEDMTGRGSSEQT